MMSVVVVLFNRSVWRRLYQLWRKSVFPSQMRKWQGRTDDERRRTATESAERIPRTANLCEVKGVLHEFPQPNGTPLRVLEDINLAVRPNEVVALLGPSGCGKSTILRILAGLIRPTRGEVFYHGQPLHGLNPGVAIVFQSFALYPWMTVQQNIETVLRAAGRPRGEIHEQALKSIRMVGLAGFEEAYPRELSGGMKQRVGMARGAVGGSGNPAHGRAVQPGRRADGGKPAGRSARHLGRQRTPIVDPAGQPRHQGSGLHGRPHRDPGAPIPAAFARSWTTACPGRATTVRPNCSAWSISCTRSSRTAKCPTCRRRPLHSRGP